MPTVPQYSDVQFGFDVRTPAAIDRRFLLTAKEMEEGRVKWAQNPKKPQEFTYIPLEDIMPVVYFVQCSDDNKLYIYDGNGAIKEDEYSHGNFRLLTKVLDVKDENDISIVDSEGIVHLNMGVEAKLLEVINDINNRINPELIRLDEEVKLRAYQVDLKAESARAEAKENDLQKQITYLGDGPYITEDWISSYDVGGVAKYQAFAEGTSIKEIVRQILNGDPREDGIIFYAAMDELPVYMKDITWSMQLIYRSTLAKEGFEIDHQVINNKILVVALPRAMVKKVGTEVDSEGHHIEVNPVELKNIYAPATPEFKYDWSYIDVKRDAFNTEWGYRLYFPCHRDPEGKAIPSKSTGDISRCYSFYLHDPLDPDPAKLGGKK